MRKRGRVVVNNRQFLEIDGVPVCKVVDGRLQFCDKDRRRSAERGTRFVEITAQELALAVRGEGEVVDA